MEDIHAAASTMLLPLRNFKLDDQADRELVNIREDGTRDYEAHKRLSSAAKRLARRDGEDEKREAVDAAKEYYSTPFTGNKCIAALAAGGTQLISYAKQAYEANPGKEAVVTGALINRFRLPYLGRLSKYVRGVNLPDNTLESLSNRNVALFISFVGNHLKKKAIEEGHVGNYATELRKSLSSFSDFPPIGLYLLLTSQAKSPEAFLEEVQVFKGKYAGLFRFGQDVTKQYVEKSNEINKTVKEYYNVHFDHLRSDARNLEGTSTKNIIRQCLLPVAGSIVGGAMVLAAGPGLPFGVALAVLAGTSVTSHGIGWAGNLLWKKRVDSHLEVYRKLEDGYLQKLQEVTPVDKAVSRIFSGKEIDYA